MLTFRADTHEYRWHGQIVPSVTQILKRMFPDLHAGIPEDVLERKKQIGQAVHEAIELLLAGALDGYELHPVVAPYVESFRAWMAQHTIATEAIEHRMYSPLGYAGTVDWVGTIDDELWIPDWKTTVAQEITHPIQTAAYRLGGQWHKHRRGCLYLQADGSPAQLVAHDNNEDIADWMAVLRTYAIMERKQ